MPPSDQQLELAEAVRKACVNAAAEAAEQAGMQGLCEDGQVEAAISAMQMLDMDAIIREILNRQEN